MIGHIHTEIENIRFFKAQAGQTIGEYMKEY